MHALAAQDVSGDPLSALLNSLPLFHFSSPCRPGPTLQSRLLPLWCFGVGVCCAEPAHIAPRLVQKKIKAYRWISDEADLQPCEPPCSRNSNLHQSCPQVADALCLGCICYSPSDEPCLKLHLQKRRGIDCGLQNLEILAGQFTFPGSSGSS